MAKVKICGIADEAALAHAITAGADYVGFVHFAKSPRHVSLEIAAALASRAKAMGKARSVVLLVDPTDELVAEVTAKVAPDIIQLHGHEAPKRVAEIRSEVGRSAIWKAVPIATKADVSKAGDYLSSDLADLLLYDAKPPAGANLPGGNGLTFDWTILDGVAGSHDFALAGGLTPKNVAEAIRLTHPLIVDVSSGVESAPGKKDPILVEHFIAAAKAAVQSSHK